MAGVEVTNPTKDDDEATTLTQETVKHQDREANTKEVKEKEHMENTKEDAAKNISDAKLTSTHNIYSFLIN